MRGSHDDETFACTNAAGDEARIAAIKRIQESEVALLVFADSRSPELLALEPLARFDVAESVGRKRTIGKHARRQPNVLFPKSLADRAAPEAIDLHFGFVARELCRRVGIGRFVGPRQP